MLPRFLQTWCAPAKMAGALAAVSCSAPPIARVPHGGPGGEESAAPTARLDPKQILHALKARGELRDCLREAPLSVGYVDLEWMVSTSGDVSSLRVLETTLEDPTAAQCLSRELTQVRFGEIEHQAAARWRFVRHLDGLPVAVPTTARKKLAKRRKAAERKARNRKGGTPDSGEGSRVRYNDDLWGKGFDAGVRLESRSDGGLEVAAIEERAHASFQLYGHCFREGFARDPELAGVVRLRLQIERDGAVSRVTDAGSDFADPEVVGCLAEGFYAMSFPRSNGGSTTVMYPLIFNIEDE